MSRLILTGSQIYQNGLFVPGDMLIENGTISGIGKEDEIASAANTTDKVIQIPGGRIIPGFFDGHLHLDQGGRFLSWLQLRGMARREYVLEAISDVARKDEGWLIAIGLMETAWPSLQELDRVCPYRPLLIHTRDYHTVLINSAAMLETGLAADTPLPEGGWQDLDADGQPLGILRENAARWIEQQLPQDSSEQLRDHLRRAFQHLLELGVTGVSDAGDPGSYEPGLLWLEENEDLPIHVESWLRCTHFGDDCIAAEKRSQGRLRRTRIKLFIDGALGSRTAWMKREYAGKAGWSAHPVVDLQTFSDFANTASESGWSLVVHAIGDAGVEHVTRILTETPAPAGRHRIEHVQHVDRDTIQLLQDSDLVFSIQPQHRSDDLTILQDRVGIEGALWSYPQKSLNIGNQLVLGTDWPVVSADPQETMMAATVKRKPGEGMPGEELTDAEAIDANTRHAADAAGFPHLGRLEPGADADLVWLTEKDGPGNTTANLDDPLDWSALTVGAVWKTGRRIKREHDQL